MAKQLAFRVVNARADLSWCLLVADLAIGYQDDGGKFIGLFETRGCALKRSMKGDLYVQFPSKPRIKGGEQQKDDQGRPIYDNCFDLYMELGGGEDKTKRAPTEAAWDARKYIIGLFEKVHAGTEAEGAGRGGAKPAPARAIPAKAPPARGVPARVGATAPPPPAGGRESIEDDSAGTPFDEEQDEDLPF